MTTRMLVGWLLNWTAHRSVCVLFDNRHWPYWSTRLGATTRSMPCIAALAAAPDPHSRWQDSGHIGESSSRVCDFSPSFLFLFLRRETSTRWFGKEKPKNKDAIGGRMAMRYALRSVRCVFAQTNRITNDSAIHFMLSTSVHLLVTSGRDLHTPGWTASCARHWQLVSRFRATYLRRTFQKFEAN